MLRTRWILCTLVLAVPALALAADWPQWRGPERTGKSKETGLLQEWPRVGPKLLWSSEELGTGYAGPAVVGGRLYVMGADGGKEYLYAIDAKTGKRVWSAEVGAFYSNPWGGGPRGTPTIEGDHLYTIGGNGNLVCVKLDTGKAVWTVNLVKDLGGSIPNWGYTESPLIDGDHVICTPGGKRGTLAALDKKTGKVVWRSTGWTDGAEYSSAVVSTAHNSRQYVQMTASSVAGVDAKTGKLQWRFPRKARITIPTPITFDNYVYITSGYGAGCVLLELTSPTEVKEVYSNTNVVNHHGGAILLDGHVYGHSDTRGWVCQNVKDGELVWSWRKFPKGSVVYADRRFYCYAETDGSVALIEATTAGWKEKGQFRIPKQSKMQRPPRRPKANFWTHPVVADGKLYLRDQELLFCYDVSGAGR